MPRWLVAAALILFGIAGGLAYGRYVAPVEYVDTIPASLRIDYRADYVLMVAESFHADRDTELARSRISLLGGASATATCSDALEFARRAPYSQADVALLEELLRSMQVLEAASSPTGTPP